MTDSSGFFCISPGSRASASLTVPRFRLLVLTMLPIGMHGAFNALGFWPAGVFRTNLFLLVYTAVIAAAAVAIGSRISAGSLLGARPHGLFGSSCRSCLFERTWNARKRIGVCERHRFRRSS